MRTLRIGAGLLAAALLGACGALGNGADSAGAAADAATPASEPGASREPATEDPADPVTVTVLAAASLTDAFTELAAEYEQQHPHVSIALSFGSSTTLAQQIAAGAEADLYASAGTAALDHLPADYAAGGGEQIVAHNVLEIAVARGNPKGVTGLEDFTRTDIDTVLCAETVPCGRAADEAFAKAGLTPTPASREIDVKATLAKVALGEADAAIVYASDVASAQDIDGVVIPAAENVVVDYPLVWFTTEAHTVGFAELITGELGREALEAAGFTLP